MKHYPSLVPGSKSKEFKAHVFEKLDGQNFCLEFTKKRGFYKFGSRTKMVDAADMQLGPAVVLFNEKYSESLTKVMTDLKLEGTLFAEYWGENSLGGIHLPSDEKFLTFFDFSPRGGIISPTDFRKLFEDKISTPNFFGIFNWTPGFVDEVKQGAFGDKEGVVGKENKQNPYMAKAKTQAWLDAIKNRFGQTIADKISDE